VKKTGAIALLGGGEWTEPCRALDSRLLHLAEADDVVIVPTAAAFEQPDAAVERAIAWFA
jgi:cyanophycinase